MNEAPPEDGQKPLDAAVQGAAEALMNQAHIRANYAAKAFVEAYGAVGEHARLVTPRGLAVVSDVQAHGPLVVIDGFIEKREPFRWAVHPDALNATIVLPPPEDEPASSSEN